MASGGRRGLSADCLVEQADVAGADAGDLAACEAQAHRPVGVDTVEAAGDAIVGAGVDLKRGADGMRAGEPCLRESGGIGEAPRGEQAGKGGGDQRGRGGRGDGGSERRGRATRSSVRRFGCLDRR